MIENDSEEFETENQELIVCPYCGYIEEHSIAVNFGPEFEGFNETFLCGGCNLLMYVERHCDISYTSRKLPIVEEVVLSEGDS